MQGRKVGALAALALWPMASATAQTAKPADGVQPLAGRSWQATGTLFEACSCNVPCPCNFGQGPTHDYCHTIYAYRLKAAQYGGVTLDGLVIGGGEADHGVVGFLDSRATPAQRPALEKLALAVFGKGGASGGARSFVTTKIDAADDPRHFHLTFDGVGGFAADVLIGRDGKNPIIVENNTTWPVARFIKGKTTHFAYKDSVGNDLHFEGVNANLGEFRMQGELGAAVISKAGYVGGKGTSCCGAGCCRPKRLAAVARPASTPSATQAR